MKRAWRKGTRLRFVVTGVAAMVLATACTGAKKAAAPGSTTATTSPALSVATTLVEATTTTEAGVPRSTTTVVLALGPGEAALSGTVSGPEGPVAGAMVRIERLVGGRGAVADVRSDDSGSWSLASILGGPYRVRAFRPPDLGAFEPQQFFLGAGEQRNLALVMTRFGENTITARVDPRPPKTFLTSRLTIRVGTGRVDEGGVLTVEPKAAVRLQLVSEGLAIESPVQQTDGDGRVSWSVRCLGVGTFPVALAVGTGLTTVPFPACIEGPAPVATVPPVADPSVD